MPSFPHMPPLAGTGTALPLKCNFHVRKKKICFQVFISLLVRRIFTSDLFWALYFQIYKSSSHLFLLPFLCFSTYSVPQNESLIISSEELSYPMLKESVFSVNSRRITAVSATHTRYCLEGILNGLLKGSL